LCIFNYIFALSVASHHEKSNKQQSLRLILISNKNAALAQTLQLQTTDLESPWWIGLSIDVNMEKGKEQFSKSCWLFNKYWDGC